ncbi:conjugal transfer protein TraD [Bradyrhizobium sp. 197]|uniref:conjugal transfer protein TraD n=1 Tax=Bradyrhizobium sp. 197 TaxID=2782663 RepID=UPI001FF8E973|nr:conjugal transfer protein TraD [Bradyrhizobium sp. 197]
MRKPKDFDADLKALEDKARGLKTRKVRQLGELVIATGADTERWGGKRARQQLEGDLTARIVAAERYGAQCARAIEVSGVEAAKDAAHIEAKKIHYLLYRIRQHAPLTVSGMLILARGMMLYEEVQKSNYCGGE